MVYKEVDLEGNISVGMAKVKEYKAQCVALKKSNLLLARAHAVAKKEWAARSENKDVPYPVKSPLQTKRTALKVLKNEESAKTYLGRLEVALAKLKEKREKKVE